MRAMRLKKAFLPLAALLAVPPTLFAQTLARTVPVSDRKVNFLLGVAASDAKSSAVTTESESDGGMLRVTIDNRVVGITPTITDVAGGRVRFDVFEITAVPGGEGIHQIDTFQALSNSAAVTSKANPKLQVAVVSVVEGNPRSRGKDSQGTSDRGGSATGKSQARNDPSPCVTCTYDGYHLTACGCQVQLECSPQMMPNMCDPRGLGR